MPDEVPRDVQTVGDIVRYPGRARLSHGFQRDLRADGAF